MFSSSNFLCIFFLDLYSVKEGNRLSQIRTQQNVLSMRSKNVEFVISSVKKGLDGEGKNVMLLKENICKS